MPVGSCQHLLGCSLCTPVGLVSSGEARDNSCSLLETAVQRPGCAQPCWEGSSSSLSSRQQDRDRAAGHSLPRTSLMQKNMSLLLVSECISGSIVGSCHQSSKIMAREEWPELHPPNREMGLSKVSYWVRVRLAGLVEGINACILCLSRNLGKALS